MGVWLTGRINHGQNIPYNSKEEERKEKEQEEEGCVVN